MSSEFARATIERERNGALAAWYDTNGRNLPWRSGRDPYRILVSEIMLQQTQVDRVVPYFERFVEVYPGIPVLAAAPGVQCSRCGPA